MKQFDKIKQDINECQSSMEMAGYIDGIRSAAIIYCKNNCPDEVIVDKSGKVEDISIYGMVEFMNSDMTINV